KAECVVVAKAFLVELLQARTAKRAPRICRQPRCVEQRALVRIRDVGRVIAPSLLLEDRLHRAVVPLYRIQLRDTLVNEATQCRVALHQRAGDSRGAVEPGVKLRVLAPVEGFVSRWSTQYACEQPDNERWLVGLEEAFGARRIHAKAHPAQRLLEALDDGAL